MENQYKKLEELSLEEVRNLSPKEREHYKSEAQTEIKQYYQEARDEIKKYEDLKEQYKEKKKQISSIDYLIFNVSFGLLNKDKIKTYSELEKQIESESKKEKPWSTPNLRKHEVAYYLLLDKKDKEEYDSLSREDKDFCLELEIFYSKIKERFDKLDKSIDKMGETINKFGRTVRSMPFAGLAEMIVEEKEPRGNK